MFVCSVPGGGPEVLQLRVHLHLRHRGPAQTGGFWDSPVLQGQVTHAEAAGSRLKYSFMSL